MTENYNNCIKRSFLFERKIMYFWYLGQHCTSLTLAKLSTQRMWLTDPHLCSILATVSSHLQKHTSKSMKCLWLWKIMILSKRTAIILKHQRNSVIFSQNWKAIQKFQPFSSQNTCDASVQSGPSPRCVIMEWKSCRSGGNTVKLSINWKLCFSKMCFVLIRVDAGMTDLRWICISIWNNLKRYILYCHWFTN